MERREFLVKSARSGWVLLMLPVGWTVASCGSDNNASPPPTANASGAALQFMSDVVGGHSHDFSITLADLTTPPAAGLTDSTTVSLGHVHAVTLTQAELSQIQSGATVTKETSLVQGHLHTFAFSLANGLSTTATGAGGSNTGSAGQSGSTGSSGSTGAGGTNHAPTGGY
jgi:uncharacterized membrane protein YgcG